MQAHHYPFIDLAVHASIRDRFAAGDAVAVLSTDLAEVLWANGAAARLFGFSNIYDVLDEGLAGQTATRRQIEGALSGLRRTGRPQAFMMRLSSGFARSMTPASLEDITLPDGAPALLMVSPAGQILAPGARARQIISGFEGTGTHVAVVDGDGTVLAASSTFEAIGLASDDITLMIADVADQADRLVKRMTGARGGPVPTAMARLADEPALHLLFAVEPATLDAPDDEAWEASTAVSTAESGLVEATPSEDGDPAAPRSETAVEDDGSAASPSADEAASGSEPQSGSEAPRITEPAVTKAAVRPIRFDISRIRDELNARLAKLRAEEARAGSIPLPFAEARDIEAASDLGPDLDPDLGPAPGADLNPDVNIDRGEDAGLYAGAEPAAGTDLDADPGTLPAAAEGPADTGMADPTDEPEAPAETLEDTSHDVPAETGETDQPAETAEPVLAGGPADLDQAAAADTGLSSTAADTAPAGPEFRFDANGKPVRFVWKIGRDGKFNEVSPEFAAAVGPNSADIVGRSFPDLARVFNLDPDHVISELLNRRDTWSGKTVYWPIQGTSLVTPVDLAALPTYTRDRQFDGFRGFGIVRMGETREDPEALGLALVPGARLRTAEPAPATQAGAEAEDKQADVPSGSAATIMSAEDEADLEMRNLERDIEELSRMDRSDETWEETDQTGDTDGLDETGASEAEAEDPFRGERPAIRLVETPMRRDSDKIIDLEARRARPRDGLSPVEQAAFREIGERLTEATSLGADTPGAEPAATEQPGERPVFGKRHSPAPGDIEIDFDAKPSSASPDAAETDADEAASAEGETEFAAGIEPQSSGATAGPRAQDLSDPAADSASEGQPDEAGWIEAPETEPMPSAFALPARQVMQTGLDASLVDAIPAALLVHSGDELIHANAEFLDLTGYGSLAGLAAQGGLDHLLDRSDEEEIGDGGMIVRRADGATVKVNARLRSINWGDGQALLLALSPTGTAPQAPSHAVIVPAEAAAPAETGQSAAPAIQAGASDSWADQAAALKIETQELRSILETATDGVVILDNDGTIRSMNGSACALFNYDEGETQGQPFAMLFAHESQRAVMDYVSGLADHGVSSVLNDGREVIGREASGGFLPLFMTIGRLSGSNGFCAVLRDITQWKRTEEELRTAKRAAETANSHKSDFLARVSHEIRTPLNAIIGFSEMMVEERFGPIGSPRYLEYAHDIGSSGKHVLDIVNDLLDISKIEAGQEQMEFVAVSLNEHLAESVSLLQPMANSQRVIIRTSLSASLPEVVADRRSIKQIALNLLSNAIRFTPSGGQIVVSTSYEPSGNVIIRIRDTGIGMTRKELEQAMKPFGQVGPGPRQRGDGTGLGLPLTKAMVEANRAQFDIVSTPSEGTLVSISFPPQRVLAD